MSAIQGKVGDFELSWLTVPSGPHGSSQVRLPDGSLMRVAWRRDKEGIWIETEKAVFGFDIVTESSENGRDTYQVRRRIVGGSVSEWRGLSFQRPGEEALLGAAGKRGVRVRAQMPGKIIRISVKLGDSVEKGQSLLVMEAMKMENEIRAAQSGRVTAVQVSEGQAVETGADLCLIE